MTAAPARGAGRRTALAIAAAFAVAAILRPAPLSAQTPDSALARYDLDRPALRLVLPHALKEISGLATTADGRLFAHDDERAEIREVDPKTGRIVKSFALGRRVVRGDFEGLAIAGGRFYLVTSDGVLYESGEGEDGARVAFTMTDTGFGASCEIEGLAFEPKDGTLLFACKVSRTSALRKEVALLRYSIAAARALPPLLVPKHAITRRLPEKTFHPSGVERDPVTGNYVIVAAREAALAEITPAGAVVAVKELDAARHAQAEGIAFLPDGSLAISDEAAGGKPMLTIYTPRTK